MPTRTDDVLPDDERFLGDVVGPLAALPGVRAVTLGGSRARGTARADSDWDLAVYYRGAFDPAGLRAVGWPGEVSEIGGWGGGVFNGGAWLTVEGRRVDVHYRDLDVVEHEWAEAEEGRFRIEPLMFHLAGIPTYLLVAELAINKALWGNLGQPGEYPPALRRSAPGRWYGMATATLAHAKAGRAPRRAAAQVAGAIALAATHTAHAVTAARGEWVTNEKGLVERAGLGRTDALVSRLRPEPGALTAAVAEAEELFARAVAAAAG